MPCDSNTSFLKYCIHGKMPCDSNASFCLGPIARPQLCAGISHSEATVCLCSPLITSCNCIYIITVHHMITTKMYQLNHNHANNLFICTLRHGGSAEPALPAAVLNWSERKRRGTAYKSIE